MGKTRTEDFMIESAIRAMSTDREENVYGRYQGGTPKGGSVVEVRRGALIVKVECQYKRLASC